MSRDTPPGRLLIAIDKLRTVDSSAPFRTLWGRALGHNTGTPEEVRNMAELGALFSRTITAITATCHAGGDDIDAHLHQSKAWGKAIFGWDLHLTSSQSYRTPQVISADARHALATEHSFIKSRAPEVTFNNRGRDQLISEIATQVDDLISQVVADEEISTQTQVYIVQKLVHLRDTIAYVEYRGDQEIISAAYAAELTLEDSAATQPDETLRERMEGWGASIAETVKKLTSAIAGPTAATYFAISHDPYGAAAIATGGCPDIFRAIMKHSPQRSQLAATESNVLQITDGQIGS